MKKICFALICCFFLALQSCAAMLGNDVPNVADDIATQMDKQIITRFAEKSPEGHMNFTSDAQERAVRERLTIMATVPVNLNNLEISCPLARQMSEEVSRWLINAGYKFQEVRKGKEIFFEKQQGEMILTRNTRLLASRTVASEAILSGTYVITPEQVRFNMRLIHTPSNEVLAMGTATVNITPDLRPLLVNTTQGAVPIRPTVNTKLQ